MNRENRDRVQELFLRVCDLDPASRAHVLDQECAGDLELRAEVESLLAHDPGMLTDSPPQETQTPESIGPYRLLETLGEGGMGIVYLAQQRTPIRRRVALKVIKPGMDSKQVLARFESERQALALMNHPNVAKVFDAGTTEEGRPYFVMEHVNGVPITDYCDRHMLENRERLGLFIQVCEAIQHAHQKGIIHRDIKPSNVLVAEVDGTAVPTVIDFGVAKATLRPLTERTLLTREGVFLGTPGYMSPEQTEKTTVDIDTRTDVYSLGVLLYELLVGSPPFDPRELRAAAFDEVLRIIRETDPPQPSIRVKTLGEEATEAARCRQTDARNLQKQLRGDLDWITMRAMEKDRTRRYASVSELSADLERFRRDEPVVARRPSTRYVLAKSIRRHRAAVTAALIVFVSLLLALVLSVSMYLRAVDAEARMTLEKQAAERSAYAARILAADLSLRAGSVREAKRLLSRCEPAERDWEWGHLNFRTHSSVAVLDGVRPAFSPSGDRLVTHRPSSDRFVPQDTWDTRTWRRVESARTQPDEPPPPGEGGLPTGTGLLTSLLENFRRVQVEDVRALGGASDARSPALAPTTTAKKTQSEAVPNASSIDKSRIAFAWTTAAKEEWVAVCEATSGKLLSRFRTSIRVSFLALDAHGVRLVAASPDGTVALHACKDGKALWTSHASKATHASYDPISSAAFGASEALVAVGSNSGRLTLFDVSTGAQRGSWVAHSGAVTALAFHSDGTKLASTSRDRTVQSWDVRSGQLQSTWWGIADLAKSLVFSPDGRWLVADDSTVTHVWAVEGDGTGRHVWLNPGVVALSFSRDGRRLACGQLDQSVSVYEQPTGTETMSIGATVPPSEAAFWLRDLLGSRTMITRPGRFPFQFAALTPAGDRLVRATRSGDVEVYDVASQRLERTVPSRGVSTTAVTFDASGTLLVIGGVDGAIDIRRWPSLDRVATLEEHSGPVLAITPSPDGRWFASADCGEQTAQRTRAGGKLVVWDSLRRVPVRELPMERAVVTSLEFSPDGRFLAVGAAAKPPDVRSPAPAEVWSTSTWTRVAVLRADEVFDSAVAVAFAPSGRRMAVGSGGSLRIFSVPEFEPLFTSRSSRQTGNFDVLRFSPDGARLVTGSVGGFHLWETRSTGVSTPYADRQEQGMLDGKPLSSLAE